MVSIISFTIQGLIIPGIIISLLVFTMSIAKASQERYSKISGWAGIWAGLVVSAGYMVSQLNEIDSTNREFSSLPEILILPLALGFVAGFSLLWLASILASTRLIGLVTLPLSAVGTSAFFNYIFIGNLHALILYVTLGVMFGVFLYVTLLLLSIKSIVFIPQEDS